MSARAADVARDIARVTRDREEEAAPNEVKARHRCTSMTTYGNHAVHLRSFDPRMIRAVPRSPNQRARGHIAAIDEADPVGGGVNDARREP